MFWEDYQTRNSPQRQQISKPQSKDKNDRAFSLSDLSELARVDKPKLNQNNGFKKKVDNNDASPSNPDVPEINNIHKKTKTENSNISNVGFSKMQ